MTPRKFAGYSYWWKQPNHLALDVHRYTSSQDVVVAIGRAFAFVAAAVVGAASVGGTAVVAAVWIGSDFADMRRLIAVVVGAAAVDVR